MKGALSAASPHRNATTKDYALDLRIRAMSELPDKVQENMRVPDEIQENMRVPDEIQENNKTNWLDLEIRALDGYTPRQLPRISNPSR